MMALPFLSVDEVLRVELVSYLLGTRPTETIITV